MDEKKVNVEVSSSDLVFVVNKHGKKRYVVPSPEEDVTNCQIRGMISLALDLLSGVEFYVCKDCDQHEHEEEFDKPPTKAY